MNYMKRVTLIFPAIVLTAAVYISGCNNDSINETGSLSDDEYLTTLAVNTAFSSDAEDDDNLFANEIGDFDSDGAVSDINGNEDFPLDSLLKWGRTVTGTGINTSISNEGDSVKHIEVKRTVNGNFIIIGYINGIIDSVSKPYSQHQKRLITFKRINNRPNPRLNWRVYKYSAVDGETDFPQAGKENITLSKAEFYRNNELVLTLNGPDFTVNEFTSRFFGGVPLFEVNPGDNVRIKIFASSNQSDTDIVAFHWSRNAFGFHRERFVMTSQIPGGNGYERTYEKSFEIYSQHNRGLFNGFISANTRNSLYDNSTGLFSSTYFGLPYKVRH
ncbi:MAG: hypothetical protein JNJ56_04405 [Ignavibacteria bacterium]|nr:hypothetical protein [Ignavibacteria bacterium]